MPQGRVFATGRQWRVFPWPQRCVGAHRRLREAADRDRISGVAVLKRRAALRAEAVIPGDGGAALGAERHEILTACRRTPFYTRSAIKSDPFVAGALCPALALLSRPAELVMSAQPSHRHFDLYAQGVPKIERGYARDVLLPSIHRLSDRRCSVPAWTRSAAGIYLLLPERMTHN